MLVQPLRASQANTLDALAGSSGLTLPVSRGLLLPHAKPSRSGDLLPHPTGTYQDLRADRANDQHKGLSNGQECIEFVFFNHGGPFQQGQITTEGNEDVG